MSHPDFMTPAKHAARIEKLASEISVVRSECTLLAARSGWPDAPVAGHDLDRLKILFRDDATLTDQLSKAVLAAHEAGLLAQFSEFAEAAEVGRP